MKVVLISLLLLAGLASDVASADSIISDKGIRRQIYAGQQYTVDVNGARTYYWDWNGNPLSPAEHARRTAEYNRYYGIQSSGATYSTTNNHGTSYSTTNNHGPSYNTINNYGVSHTTINNYGRGHTTVNDFGAGSSTTTNRRRRR